MILYKIKVLYNLGERFCKKQEIKLNYKGVMVILPGLAKLSRYPPMLRFLIQ